MLFFSISTVENLLFFHISGIINTANIVAIDGSIRKTFSLLSKSDSNIQIKSNTAPCNTHHLFWINFDCPYKNSKLDNFPSPKIFSFTCPMTVSHFLMVSSTAVSLTYRFSTNFLYSLIFFLYFFTFAPPILSIIFPLSLPHDISPVTI